MQRIQSILTQFRGSHYELGLKQGKQLKNSWLFFRHKEQLQPSKRPKFTVDTTQAERLLKSYASGLWEELEGLAEGLDIPVKQTVAIYSGFQQEWIRSGCSILTTNELFVRNYDYHPKTYEGRYVLFQPENSFASIGPAQRITGRTDGMNEKGLVVGYNFVNRRGGGDGFIPTVVTRMILETCQSNEEAIWLARHIPHRHTFNFMLYDKDGESHVVEASPRGVQVRKSRYSTNHFELMPDENRYHMADSIRRFEILKEKSSKEMDEKEAFRLFNHKEHQIFSEEYSKWAGTIHTSIYQPAKLEVGFALGGNKFPVGLSFADWLEGKDLPIKSFRGRLNTEEPIPFMNQS